MSNSTDAPTGKNYAIMRVERIRDLAEMRRIEQHNTREKQSENVEPGGPAPRELLPDAHTDTVSGARERMVELGLDLAKLTGAVGVEVILTTSHAWWAMATDQMKQDWIDANLRWLEDKFGRALLSAKLHEDEKTPHIHAVALSAVSKIDSVRGPKPKTDEGWARRRAEEEKRKARWRWNYRDLFGQDFEHLSREQDRYHAAVAHLGLDRGERRREVTDVVLENGVVIPASQLARGKRRDGSDRPRRTVTTQQNQAAARDDRARAAEERRQAEQDREAVAVACAAANADRAATAAARAAADAFEQQADADRRVAAKTLADVERQRKVHEDAIAAQRRELADMLAAAAADRAETGHLRRDIEVIHIAATATQRRNAAEAVAAEQVRRDAEATRTAAVAERAAAAADRRELDERRALHVAQLALLARTADDANGLDLRISGRTFVMRESQMTDAERAAHKQPWSPPLVMIARALAVALEGLRDITRRLAGREKVASEREAATVVREAKLAQDRKEHDAQVASHRAAIDDLDRRQRTVDDIEARAAAMTVAASKALDTAKQTQATANEALASNRRWMLAMDALESDPESIEVTAGGSLRLDRYVAAARPDIARVFEEKAPAWVMSLAMQRLELADAAKRAIERENEAIHAATRLAEMIEHAGPVLTPVQQDTFDKAASTLRRFDPRQGDRGL